MLEVMYDMKAFIFVLFFTLAAFGDAMSTIAVANNPAEGTGEPFITSF